MRQFCCPYCSEELPPPTRKCLCPHCGKTIVVRTRPHQDPAWVRVEDIPAISKEWADEMLRRDIERRRATGIEGLELVRHNIREWEKSGVVKSLTIRSAEDDAVCEACKQMSGRIFPIETNEQISFVMDNAHVQNCRSQTGCRCYWRPEEIL
jgi:hypothetical protein